MAAIEAIGGPLPEDMRNTYDKPFGTRVGGPAQEWVMDKARTIAGVNWAKNTTRRLEMAGNPPYWSVDRVLTAKVLCAVALGAVTVGVMILFGKPVWALIGGIGLAVLGFFLPDSRLQDMAKKRSKAIQKELPDSLDLLTVSVESGLAFDAALAQVAQNTDGPLSDEFRRVLKEVQIGSSRSDALRALAGRTDVEDLRIFISSMIQAEKLGMPIAEVLRVQAGEMRIKRSQRIEEAANKLPIKMIFPILFCIMPAVFIVLIGPAVLQIGAFFGNS
jgi:tight adherence protein C